jgi:hypothetical protein
MLLRVFVALSAWVMGRKEQEKEGWKRVFEKKLWLLR